MSRLLPYSDPPSSERRLRFATTEKHDDPLIYIERESRHLQRQIQTLLDAQSDGLLASLQSPGSASSVSAVESRERSVRMIPVRQPPKKKISLRAARKGILQSMSDLLSLREVENRLLHERIQERQDAIEEVDTFANKKAGLEKTLSDLENDREGNRARKLKGEAKSLEHKIEELELELADMKARHRHIIQEVSRLENAVDAKLSSYKESLSILDTEVRQYLERPPLKPLQNDKKSSFYSLHPNRRKLEMAREHWQTEQSELAKRQEAVDLEIAALDNGGPVWQSVVKEISGFERKLKDEMQQYIMLSKSSRLPSDNEEVAKREQGKKIIEDLESTMRVIEEKLELAEQKDWRLLVCSIGAELAALREAQDMLKQMFDYMGQQDAERENDVATEPTTARNSVSNLRGSDQRRESQGADLTTASTTGNPPTISMSEDEHADEPPADLLQDATSAELQPATFRSEDEDDEPDPAWLLSDP
ncbi:conserved hypothetical protein [Talaromyces stipitatus ATCC 10500]|uniref:Autophagy-related protein Atg28 n=1 Tax=Talaromyces stipitatus (strain ATCC 10500 / CBS 375.48 / QM 6759 / NRRL 1006) TaxID=441959 RepID=B8MHU5_TALSN|nr:uncharacterized protein TSTA_015130 [Talaromyces stipitatus ATCC 10500]EED16425.1 conserved hypothetical protein [Talaromyces stipitatus ATCC 10500]